MPLPVGGGKTPSGKQLFEGAAQVNIVCDPCLVEVNLGEHEVPSKHECLSAVPTFLLDAQTGSSALWPWYGARRCHQPIQVKLSILDPCVVRVAK